jgi:hypothetical protein
MNKILFTFILLTGCVLADPQEQKIIQQNKNDSIDHVKAGQSMAVIKVKLLQAGAGNKFIFDQVAVLEVLSNKTDYRFSNQIEVAHYSVKNGIPENKECILYLTAFPFGATELNTHNEWMLLEGDGTVACECQ